MALEKLEYPATGTVTESWLPTRNPSYAGAPRRKNYRMAADESAGNQLYAYGSVLWTYLLTRQYGSLSDAEWSSLENFADMVGANYFKFTDPNGVPWKVKFADFERPSLPVRGDRWDADFTLRAELKPHPSLSKIPAQFHKYLLFYAPLTSNLDAFSRWDPTATFSRSTTGTYRNSAGIMVTAAANAARHEYSNAGVALGVLIEPQRTNQFLRSEQFDNASWTKNNGNIAADQIAAPDNTTTADKFTEVFAAGTQHGVEQVVSLSDNQDITISVFARGGVNRDWIFLQLGKRDGTVKRAWFNITTGTKGSVDSGGTSRIEAWTNSWYRCSLSINVGAGASSPSAFICASEGDGSITHGGDPAYGMYLWGAQHEVGTSPTSYIPTVGSTVTRNADDLTYLATGHILSIAGTIAVVGDGRSGHSPITLVQVDDGGDNNRFVLLGNAAQPQFTVISGGATQASILAAGGADDFTDLTQKKLIGCFAANDFELLSSAVSRGTDTSGSVPSGMTTIRIGDSASAGSENNGHIRDICIFAKRLTVAEAQTLSNAL